MNAQILYVDDNEEIRNLVNQIFESDYTIHTCTSVSEAKQILSKNKDVGIILSDYHLPEVSGLDFFKELSEDDHMAVRILLTGDDNCKQIEEALEQDIAYKCVFKPFSVEDIIDVVKQAFQLYVAKKRKKEILNRVKMG